MKNVIGGDAAVSPIDGDGDIFCLDDSQCRYNRTVQCGGQSYTYFGTCNNYKCNWAMVC